MPSPQLQKLIESFDQPDGDPDASQEEKVAAYRLRMDSYAAIDGVAPSIAVTTEIIEASAAGVPSEWVLAEGADPDLRLLFIHGGAFIGGSLGGYRHQVEALSRATGMALLAVGYRLAPEHIPTPPG